MYCRFENHDFQCEEEMAKELVVVHIARLAGLDPTLQEISDLAPDMGAECSGVGQEWVRFPDADD